MLPLQHCTLLTEICRLLSLLCRLGAAVAGPPRQPEQEREYGELQQPAHQRHLARPEARGPHQVVVPDEEAVGRQHEAAAGHAGPGHGASYVATSSHSVRCGQPLSCSQLGQAGHLRCEYEVY